jgi:uncharacterized protein
MAVVTALLAGLVFGLGLIVSGMADPGKVLGFLDLAGAWNPSLAFVMGGAVGVGAVAFALAGRRKRSLLGGPMQLPGTRGIDHRRVIGGLVFGIGWGLAGFCPGPAWVAVGMGSGQGILFGAAMLAGVLAFEVIERRRGAAVARP